MPGLLLTHELSLAKKILSHLHNKVLNYCVDQPFHKLRASNGSKTHNSPQFKRKNKILLLKIIYEIANNNDKKLNTNFKAGNDDKYM